MTDQREGGWFADIDNEGDDPATWQPVLAYDGGCVAVSVWFHSERECLDFIRDVIVGKGMLEPECDLADIEVVE